MQCYSLLDVKGACHFGWTNQIKGQRSRGQRFNGPPKLNVRAQVKGPRLIPISSSIIFFSSVIFLSVSFETNLCSRFLS